ncbi:GNAT family N-acetyltransferase [Paenibacillus eucommiae]|uniref:Aminoglycoside 6'-N-acetyltransferase n=1 Tax=Paenibacillus eucommiae TaxID=1355755 RepID=A0ABS4J3J8_9BACL|nr:GNAT family N-acetyltransferase [Paenibacillus eucommiae]MBP1994419.1 aminoglycoside 6'-N-acetyltransferase [Paenibacillus eucommiae]
MLVSDGQLSIRKMLYTDEDFSLLFKWLNDKEVLSYIEGPGTKYTHEQIIEKYGPRAKGEHYVTPCIIECNHSPIGYLQFYQLQEVEIQEYGVKEGRPQYGMDIFIGETDYWNKGVGTAALKSMVRFLFTEREAEDIYIDPQTWNIRAIKSYEKCGFKKVKILYERELFDGVYKDNQLMRISYEEFLVS